MEASQREPCRASDCGPHRPRLAISCDKEPTIVYRILMWRLSPRRIPETPREPVLKKALAARDRETWALAIVLAWLLAAKLLAVLAWETGLLTRQAALLHWLVVGVLPPALALWSLPANR